MSTEITPIQLPSTEEEQESLFTSGGIGQLLDTIEGEARSLVLDATTAKGRAEIKSHAHAVAKTKTLIDGAGKKLVAGIKSRSQAIDAGRKECRDRLDALKAEIRKPVTEFEEQEKARIDKHQLDLADLEGMAFDLPSDSDTLKEILSECKEVSTEDRQEFQERFETTMKTVLEKVDTALTEAIKAEEERAELEKLRKEKEEREKQDRIRQEKEEREAREKKLAEEAAEKAKAEAQAEAQRKLDEQAAEAQRKMDEQAAESRRKLEEAAREKAEAEQKAAQEKQAREAEAKRIADEEAAKLADKKHVNGIKKAVYTAILDVITEARSEDPEKIAKVICTAINAGEIEHVTINY